MLLFGLKEAASLQGLSFSFRRSVKTCKLLLQATWVKLLLQGQALEDEGKRDGHMQRPSKHRARLIRYLIVFPWQCHEENNITPNLWLGNLGLRRWHWLVSGYTTRKEGIWPAFTSPQVCCTCPILPSPPLRGCSGSTWHPPLMAIYFFHSDIFLSSHWETPSYTVEFWGVMSSNPGCWDLFFYGADQPTLKHWISSRGWNKQTLSILEQSLNVSFTGAKATSSSAPLRCLAML